MEYKKVIVIGAGPSGLAAALSALKEGASVVVLEHMEEPGVKLLLTGNGQCNLSNTEVSPQHYHGNTEVIKNVIDSFSFDDMISFMKQLGVETEICRYRFEDCGYLYPSDHKASTVRNHMVQSILEKKGEIVIGCTVDSISVTEDGITVSTSKGLFESDSLIFATGSNAYPKTGSDSSIYPILKSLGIVQKTWLPALTALKSNSEALKLLAGLRADAQVMLVDEDTRERFESKVGEIQFREHFISGLPVMQLSRYASIGLHNKDRMTLYAYLKKANNKDGILPFTEVSFNITGTEGFDHAVCCSGGIDHDDIRPETLQSTQYKNLYFCGEMIDVDGDCGGFNLHFAIASGILAGRNASR